MKLNKILVLPLFSLILLVNNVSAHCPLCVIGAGAVAFGAEKIGVNPIAVALLIGGFAMSMGLWTSRLIKKKFFRFQDIIITMGIFFLTLLPILPIIGVKTFPFYLSWFGNYGSIFNKTYILNLSLFGSIFGGLIVFSTPFISKKITKLRKNKTIPFQGTILTLLLLLIMGGILQLIL